MRFSSFAFTGILLEGSQCWIWGALGFISRGSQCAQDWGEKENSGLGRNYRRSWSCTDLGNAGGRRLLSAVFDICKVDIP